MSKSSKSILRKAKGGCGRLKRKDWDKVKGDISDSWNSHWPLSRSMAFSRLTRKGATPRCASKLVRGIFSKLRRTRPLPTFGDG